MFLGLRPGQLVGWGVDVAETAIRSAKTHVPGLIMAGIAADVAISAGMAPKGEQIPEALSSFAGTGAGYIAGGIVGSITGALIPIPGAPYIGNLVGGIIGDAIVRSSVGAAGRKSVKMMHNSVNLQVGGNYQDTKGSITMRQRASQEMSGSLLNARMWLGKESALMHG